MSFQLAPLPYDYGALGSYVDEETMAIHHKCHHKTYVDKLNEAIGMDQNTANLRKLDIVSLNQSMDTLPQVIRNNGGGHYNHSLFWKWMAPVGQSNSGPAEELKIAIYEAFGSVDEMKKTFTDAALARFGSGWAWLGVKPDGSLGITSTANQENPLMKGIVDVEMIPILGLDVWEHAYYLKYQNKRAEYIQAWWNVVNWDQVVECYDKYASKGLPVPI